MTKSDLFSDLLLSLPQTKVRLQVLWWTVRQYHSICRLLL